MMKNEILLDVLPLLMSNGNNSIFFEFYEKLVEPKFDSSIPTAQVSLCTDTDTPVQFIFNQNFWESLIPQEKLFVFIHEILHVLFRHGSRGKKFLDDLPEEKRSEKVLNIAMDITINELIMEQYVTYPLSMLPVLSQMICTIDSCFPISSEEILEDQKFEYYYHKLIENQSENLMSGFDLLDIKNLTEEELNKIEAEILQIVKEKVEIEEDQQIESKAKNSDGYSLDDLKSDSIIRIIPEIPKGNLEKHLDLFIATKFGGNEHKPIYRNQWHGTQRRNTTIQKNLILPMRKEITKKKGKHHIVVYADVSGSVSSHTKTFISLIDKLNSNKFVLDLFVFASYVGQLKRENNSWVYPSVGGGTNISKVLKHFSSNYIKTKPEAVLVLTDGSYNNITTLDDDFYSTWTFFMTYKSKNKPIKSNVVHLFG
jgi:predicted metal-dependent peptidase